jgi:hypothetical protein
VAPSGTSSPATPATAFPYVPLYPFASVADAAAWQREAAQGGHQPWRLDAGITAVSFARDYLQYGEIDRVTSSRVGAEQAWIGVGSTPLEGRQVSAAVIHLVRIGAGPVSGRPWEVVGTEDTSVTLTVPRYGSVVGSQFTAAGRITGVDESLSLQVRSLTAGTLAQVTGVPAGGQAQPWRIGVTVRPAEGPATLAVATGGHLRAVERFAVTGVRVRSGAPDAAP